MAKVENSIDFVLKNEGGYTNHPLDQGGPTNYGITMAEVSKLLGRQATTADVKNLTREQACEILRRDYWAPLNLDQVNHQGIATAIFDMALLCGWRTAGKRAQRALFLKEDAWFDAGTLKAINTSSPDTFIYYYKGLSADYFRGIVKRKPKQKVFLKGWLNRVARMDKLTLVSNEKV